MGTREEREKARDKRAAWGLKYRADITRPSRKGQIWKRSQSGSQSWKAVSVPGKGLWTGLVLEERVG